MVSTPEGCTKNSPMETNPSVSTKNNIAIKPLHLFSKKLNVKHNTALRRLGASEGKRKSNKTGNVLWSNIRIEYMIV